MPALEIKGGGLSLQASSRFAGARPWVAWAVLVALAALAVYGSFSGYVRLPESPGTMPTPPVLSDPSGLTDGHLYYRIIDRVRAGENYYEAAIDEMRARGYALRPFFNVRMPTLAVVLAQLPEQFSHRYALWSLIFLTAAAWLHRLRSEGASRLQIIAGGILIMSGLTFHAALAAASLHHEVWSSCFLALSLALYKPERWFPSVLL